MVQSMEAFCQRVRQGLAEATFEQKRHLIELLIDRVIVTNEEVEIRYVIPTNPSSEHLRFCHLRLDYFDLPTGTIQIDQILSAPHCLVCRGYQQDPTSPPHQLVIGLEPMLLPQSSSFAVSRLFGLFFRQAIA
jgi:hypothetical protein